MLRILVLAIFILALPVLLPAQRADANATEGGIGLRSGGLDKTTALSYDIATWEGFRTAAVSYTFDDNCPNQLAIAVPMFNQFGFKLTLFTVTSSTWGWRANWGGLQAAADAGHEIASHTIDHSSLGSQSDSLQKIELELSQDTINAHIVGHECLTFAYPNCVTGNSTLVSQYYIAARGCSGQIVSSTPANYMNISSFVCGNLGLNTADDMESKANNAVTSKGWVAYLIHGINGTEPGAYSPISQDTIQATLQYFSAHQDQFWVAPFGMVVRYAQERNAADITETSANGDSITVRVHDIIDAIYTRVPLTLRRPLPNGWDSVLVRQDSHNMTSKIVKVDTVSYVIFDGVPNAGIVTIFNETGTRVGVRNESSSPRTFGLFQNYPNPFNPSTELKFSVATTGKAQVEVFNIVGQRVALLYDEIAQAGQFYRATFDGANLASGLYLGRLQSGNSAATMKMILLK